MLSRVWELSAHGGTELLMLLAIADFADDNGIAYPSVGTLAAKCRMTSRNANLILAELRASGELQIKIGGGPKGVNRYRVVINGQSKQPTTRKATPLKPASGGDEAAFRGEDCFRGDEAGFPKPLKPASDKPSLNRQRVGAHAAQAPAPGQDSARGTRLPDDWTLPADWRAWAIEKRPDLDPDAVAETFADHWRAQPGAKGRKADWFATWRNWVRNERGAPGTVATTAPARPASLDTAYDFADEVSR